MDQATTRVAEGIIRRVNVNAGIGFIKVPAGEVFFHRSVLDPRIDFDERLREMPVSIEFTQTPRGLRATAVRPLS